MEYVNLALSKLVDWVCDPFSGGHPFWPLLLVSAVTGLAAVAVFRLASSQTAMRENRRRTQAYVMELGLFRHDPTVLWSAQKRILLGQLHRLRLALPPTLILIPMLGLEVIHLDGWFGVMPLRPGESAVVSVFFSAGLPPREVAVVLDAGPGVRIETPPLAISRQSRMDWRIRAVQPGRRLVTVAVGGIQLHKTVQAAEGRLSRVSRERVASTFPTLLLSPGEAPLPAGSPVSRIEIAYPARSIEIFGRDFNWLVVFLVLSLAAMMILRPVLGVVF